MWINIFRRPLAGFSRTSRGSASRESCRSEPICLPRIMANTFKFAGARHALLKGRPWATVGLERAKPVTPQRRVPWRPPSPPRARTPLQVNFAGPRARRERTEPRRAQRARAGGGRGASPRGALCSPARLGGTAAADSSSNGSNCGGSGGADHAGSPRRRPPRLRRDITRLDEAAAGAAVERAALAPAAGRRVSELGASLTFLFH